MRPSTHRLRPEKILLLAALLWGPATAQAMPVFARQYGLSCNACHAAYPRLNRFGEQFRDNNLRLPNWREQTTVDTHDQMLALPKMVPLAIRAQAYVQERQGEEVTPGVGPTGNNSQFDFQAPYLIKLLSSAPLSERVTYYFYGIFAEKGENGTTVIEDAWFRYANAFDTGVGAQLGQFQISDLMFPRELRMTFQDYMAYRLAGLTYDRGLLLDRELGRVRIALGVVNGNGIDANYNINSPGYLRPDAMFDNNSRKNVFGRVGVDAGPVTVGVFGLTGQQESAGGTLGDQPGTRETNKRALGLDLSGVIAGRAYWFVQALWNRWDGFLDTDPTRSYDWSGGFAGVDYVYSDRWVYSLLYNYDRAGDFAGTNTVFEGIKMNSLTLATTYYFMRNLKGIVEVNVDFLPKDNNPSYVGHVTREGYILVGMDTAF